MTTSEINFPEESLAGERLFGATSASVLDSVVTCTPPRAMVSVRTLSTENMLTTSPCPSSVSRRLSREFRMAMNAQKYSRIMMREGGAYLGESSYLPVVYNMMQVIANTELSVPQLIE